MVGILEQQQSRLSEHILSQFDAPDSSFRVLAEANRSLLALSAAIVEGSRAHAAQRREERKILPKQNVVFDFFQHFRFHRPHSL